jgi:hypothetical protein
MIMKCPSVTLNALALMCKAGRWERRALMNCGISASSKSPALPSPHFGELDSEDYGFNRFDAAIGRLVLAIPPQPGREGKTLAFSLAAETTALVLSKTHSCL